MRRRAVNESAAFRGADSGPDIRYLIRIYPPAYHHKQLAGSGRPCGFNNEHVFPEWLQRRFALFDKTIRLPNGTNVRYDRWTVPCCADCNKMMGDAIETPISKIVKGGADSINEFLRSGEALKLFVWLGLIFVKTHLRDQGYRFNLDRRLGEGAIADLYDWEQLHHVHCVCRCFYNDAEVSPNAIGSMLAIPVESQGSTQEFDYSDLFWPQTACIRLGDVAILAVFNDSGAANSILWDRLRRIRVPINELQLRELTAEYAFVNAQLKVRPQFHTRPDPVAGKVFIEATRPQQIEMDDPDFELRGQLMHSALQEHLPRLVQPGLSPEEFEAEILAGKTTFLFDESGNFLSDGLQPVTAPTLTTKPPR